MKTSTPGTAPSKNNSLSLITQPPSVSPGLVRSLRRDERGQTTAEYGLVLLAAATIAMLVVAWAGGTGAIGSFFDAIIDKITSLIA